MTPRPALAVTIAASMLVLGTTGALAAGSPQLAGHAPDKTSPTTTPVAPTTTVPEPTRAPTGTDCSDDDWRSDDLHDPPARQRTADRARSSTPATPSRSASTTPTSPPHSPTSRRGGPRSFRACTASRSRRSPVGSSPPIRIASPRSPGAGSPATRATRRSATTGRSTARTVTSSPTTTASSASSTTSPKGSAPRWSPS